MSEILWDNMSTDLEGTVNINIKTICKDRCFERDSTH